MKKFLLLAIVLLCSQVHAQSITTGAAAIYGDDIDNLGIHLRAYYNLWDERVCFGPEYTYFFPTTRNFDGEEVEIGLSEFNFNMHYIFEVTHKIGVYPLAGFNLSRETEQGEGLNHKSVQSEVGLNLGAGFHVPFGDFVVFAEYDRLFSELAQNSFLVGVLINFGEKPGSHSMKE